MRKRGILLAAGTGACACLMFALACGDTSFSGSGAADGATDALSDGALNDSAPSADAGGDGGMVECGSVPGTADIFAKPTTGVPDFVATDGVYLYWASEGPSMGTIERSLISEFPAGTIHPVAVRPSKLSALAVNSYACWILASAYGTTGQVECGSTAAIGTDGIPDSGIIEGQNTSARLVATPGYFLYSRSTMYEVQPPDPGFALLFNDSTLVAVAPPHVVVMAKTDAGASGFFELDDHPGSQSLQSPFYVDPGSPTEIATDGVNTFVTYGSTGIVARVPFDGGASVPIASGQNGPNKVVLNGENVYFTAADGIWRVSTDGTCLTHIAVEATTSMTIASGYVYFASGGNILRARK